MTDTPVQPDPQSSKPTPPAQTRSWWRVHWVFTLILLLLIMLVVAVVALYGVATTDKGSRYLLNTISNRAGIDFQYGAGNLVDGIWITNLNMDATKTININVDKAFVKVGWRAILDQQVHLREAYIHKLTVENTKPPSGDPFEFKTIELPINIRIDRATVDAIAYHQVTKQPIAVKDAVVAGFGWNQSKIRVQQGNFDYIDVVDVSGLTGSIDLQGDYPLDIQTNVKVYALEKQHVSPLRIQADGTLRDLTGTVQGLYNQSDVRGKFAVNPVAETLTFDAKVVWDEIALPYAVDQNIRLSEGSVIADGTLSSINITLDTVLTAKDIPNGRYHGHASTDLSELTIDHLTADLPEGQLVTQGKLGWSDGFSFDLNNHSRAFDIRALLPEAYQPYAPQRLNGYIKTRGEINDGVIQVDAEYHQQEGEAVQASLVRRKKGAPLKISANWQHLVRDQLPAIGILSSPEGLAEVSIGNDDIQAYVNTQIEQANAAPVGQYIATVAKQNNLITVSDFDYQGQAGNLAGEATVKLASRSTDALTWQADLTTDGFLLSQLGDPVPNDLPISELEGQIVVSGDYVNNKVRADISQVDLTVTTAATTNTQPQPANPAQADQTPRQIYVSGAGEIGINLDAKNQLQNFSGRYVGQLQTQDLPTGVLQLDVQGTPQQIQVKTLKHESEAGYVDMQADIGIHEGIRWDVNANMSNFNIGYFVPDMSSELTGTVATEGIWHSKRQRIAIKPLDIRGTLNEQPFSGQGSLFVNTAINTNKNPLEQVKQQSVNQLLQQVSADNLNINWSNNYIIANSKKHAASDNHNDQLLVDVSLTNLEQLVDKLQGTVVGKLAITTDPTQRLPSIHANIEANELQLPKLYVGAAKLQAHIVDMANQPSKASLIVSNTKLGENLVETLLVNAVGTQAKHHLKAKTRYKDADITLGLQGGYDLKSQQWQGKMYDGAILTTQQLRQTHPAMLTANLKTREIRVEAHCWQVVGATGALCIRQPLQASTQGVKTSILINNLDASIASPFLPKDLSWQAKLNGIAKVDWQQGRPPVLDAAVYSDNGLVGVKTQSIQTQPTQLRYNRISVIAKTLGKQMQLRADIDTPNVGTGYVSLRLSPQQKPMPIKGKLALDSIMLAPLQAFLPQLRNLQGQISVASQIGGTLQSPQLQGQASLTEGAFSVVGTPVALNDIQLVSRFDGQQARFEGRFNSGAGGTGQLAGRVDWQDALSAKFDLKGEALQVAQPPMLSAAVSPDLSIEVRPLEKYAKLKGTVFIPEAIIRPPQASNDVITSAESVTVFDRRSQDSIDDVLAVSKPWDINTDVEVAIGQNVEFRGFGAVLPLSGGIQINSSAGNNISAKGAIVVDERTTVEAFGQRLDLNYARINFVGSLTQPLLNIEAQKDVQDEIIRLRIKGNPANPDISVYNDAGLTEQQAINALVTGRIDAPPGTSTNAAGFKSEINNTIAAAGLSYGFSGTRAFTNDIGRAFGLQGLTVDAAGTNDDTQVNITGYINPDLYVRYGVGVFTPVNTLTLRYQLTKRIYLEATSSIENAVDVFYNWKF